MALFDILRTKEPTRSCSHCGAEMAPLTSAGHKTWECPKCHNRMDEIASGDRSSPVFSAIYSETGPREPITDRQRQFLLDLGEIEIPRFKYEASRRIDQIVTHFDSWLGACFRKPYILDRPALRRLQIAL